MPRMTENGNNIEELKKVNWDKELVAKYIPDTL